MTGIPFTKMSGSGNDFIVIDNRSGDHDAAKDPGFVRAVCRRKLSVGADGLIVIEPSRTSDFSWRFFNADGSEAEMCGNGGRCAARFAVLYGIAGPGLSFETLAGTIQAQVSGARVRIRLPEPKNLITDYSITVGGTELTVHSINTGVPHVVMFVDSIESAPVRELGSEVRYHRQFQPAGTNVNFVSQAGPDMLQIRTYERGVEDETLACGTGSVAAALVACAIGRAALPVRLQTRSGEVLQVDSHEHEPPFKTVFFEGDTRHVCEGTILREAFEPRQA